VSETQFRFTEEDKVVFLGWLIEHPEVVRSSTNASLFGNYLQANNLKSTAANIDQAYKAIKSQLQLNQTEEQIEADRIEAIRASIWNQTAERIAPAVLNFKDPVTVALIYKWLNQNAKGHQSVDLTVQAITALRLELPWVKEPEGLQRSAKSKEFGFQDSRDESNKRYNHAEADKTRAAINKEKAKLDSELQSRDKAEENARIEFAISGYEATCFNRTDRGLTETIQGLLRTYVRKFGGDGKSIKTVIRELPDEPRAAEQWLRNKIGTGPLVTEPLDNEARHAVMALRPGVIR